jgi:murein DD-endopeptidase MepM/ murein hydrolase activator NlpD
MKSKLLSLIILSDSGSDIRVGSFHQKLILTCFGFLAGTLLVCLYIIIGFHIKLAQEQNYKQALVEEQRLIKHIKSSKKLLSSLSEKLAKIQTNDRAFRLMQNMNVIDNDMYRAGIGGHVIVDESKFADFDDTIRKDLIQLSYNSTVLDRQLYVQDNSLKEIHQQVQLNRELIDATPSIFPTELIRITSFFGWRRHPVTGRKQFHDALDLGGSIGQKIFATADGIITYAGWRGRLGYCIEIQHKYGYKTIYGHLNKINVTIGQKVKKCDFIGTMGCSGNATGTHTHYSISLNGKTQNPLKIIMSL